MDYCVSGWLVILVRIRWILCICEWWLICDGKKFMVIVVFSMFLVLLVVMVLIMLLSVSWDVGLSMLIDLKLCRYR